MSIAQLDRASDYGSEGREFESSWTHQTHPSIVGDVLFFDQMTHSHPNTLKDSRGRNIPLGKVWGRGGQGTVYQVHGSEQWAAKVYNHTPNPTESAKLQALVQCRTPALSEISTWPSATLHDQQGAILGFLMPLVNLDQYHELHQLYTPHTRHKVYPQADWEFLVHTARNVVRAFASLHVAGHLMGDISGRNIMVSPQGVVRLIDTDSFQITHQGHTYPCPVGTAEFTPPELQSRTFGEFIRSEQHDLFGMAVLLFHLLFEGRHPYAGIHNNGELPSPAQAISANAFAYTLNPIGQAKQPPATLSLHTLPTTLQDLFEDAFHPQQNIRPSADVWEEELINLQKNIATCTNNTIHKYYQAISCPWCELEQTLKRATELTGESIHSESIQLKLEYQWQEALKLAPANSPQLPHFIMPQQKLSPLVLKIPPKPRLPMHIRRLAVPLHWLLRVSLTALFIIIGFWLQGVYIGITCILLCCVFFAGRHRFSGPTKKIIDYYCDRERELVGYVLPNYRAKQEYSLFIVTTKHSLETQIHMLQQHLDSLTDQYNDNYNRYQQDLEQLRQHKSKLEDLLNTQLIDIQSAVKKYRNKARNDYLKKQTLKIGVLPYLDAKIVSILYKHHIKNAYDIHPEKLKRIPQMTPYGLYTLVRWRSGLASFFTYDPSLTPSGAIDQAKRLSSPKIAQAWQNWQQKYQTFKITYQEQQKKKEQQLVLQIRETKAKIIQLDEALSNLPEDD